MVPSAQAVRCEMLWGTFLTTVSYSWVYPPPPGPRRIPVAAGDYDGVVPYVWGELLLYSRS